MTVLCVLGSVLMTNFGIVADESNKSVSIVPLLNQTTVTDNWDQTKTYTFPALSPVPQEFMSTGPHDMINTTLYPDGACRNDSSFLVFYIEMHSLFALAKTLNKTDLWWGNHYSCHPHGLHQWHHHNAVAKITNVDTWTDNNQTAVLMPIFSTQKCKEGERVDSVDVGVCEDAFCDNAWLVDGQSQRINNT